MTSRARRYGTLLSVVLALLLATALAACSDEGDPGSLLERAAEREATQEAETSGSQSLSESSALDPTTESTVELGACTPGPANPPPALTSAESDKDALLAIFDATDGDSWDESGTWAGRKPIGEWEGVTTRRGRPRRRTRPRPGRCGDSAGGGPPHRPDDPGAFRRERRAATGAGLPRRPGRLETCRTTGCAGRFPRSWAALPVCNPCTSKAIN